MKIIDAHVHFSKVAAFEACATSTSKVDYSLYGYIEEAGQSEVVSSVCMGLTESAPCAFPDTTAATPMLANMSAQLPPGMSLCLGINPYTLDSRGIAEIEELVSHRAGVVGIKIYAGYYHVDVSSPVYEPVYQLASRHDLAVAIHSGDTYSSRSLLKYAHPLCIDELAVTHPMLRIVICHMGAPWVFDACEVAVKNPNVYIDLSGILVGSASDFGISKEVPLMVDRCRQALIYLDDYDKVLFGTDWPLAPMGAYIGFVKQLVPPDAYERVFYRNAARVYKL